MKRKQWSQRLRHVVLMCAAAFGLTAFGDEVSVSKPVVKYGADYTRATVTAEVEGTTSGDVTYELTVTKGTTTQTYTGTVSGGTVTFADVEVPRDAANIYADITYTVTPKAGTAALTSAATTEAPTTKSEWEFSSTVSGVEVVNNGGSWTAGAPTVAAGRLSVNDATFTAKPKSADDIADDIVVITMEGVIFGDINDAEIADAQAGIRIGESGEFEVLSATEWIKTEIPAKGEEAYDVVLTINYATKKYSVKIGTGTFADISLAGSETGVNAIEFNGSGSLASLAGEAYDGNMVVDNDGKKYATVAAAIAALKAGTATAPLTMLHTGTEPAGWTIDENGVLTQVGIVVDGEVGTGSEKTFILAVPKSTTPLTAATLINTANRVEGDQLKVYVKSAKSYYSWQLVQLGDTLVWDPLKVIVATDAGQSETNSPGADTIQLTAGQGVWVTVKDDSKTVLLNGQYAGAEEKVAVALETGWNLVAPPPKEGENSSYSINSVVSAAAAAEGDRIVVPTAGVPYNLTKGNDGKWGYYKITTTYSEEKKRNVTHTEWVDEVTVPSGTGFWYINGGDSTKNISL